MKEDDQICSKNLFDIMSFVSLCVCMCVWYLQEGDVVVKCHQTGDEAVVTWSPHSKAKERYRELNGKVLDNKGEVVFILHGAWDKGMTRRRPGKEAFL